MYPTATTNRRLGRGAAPGKSGDVTQVKEDDRTTWSVVWFEQWIQDARYGMGMLRRTRGFSMAVILKLALGIGMNTAMFSVLESVLLHRVPIRMQTG